MKRLFSFSILFLILITPSIYSKEKSVAKFVLPENPTTLERPVQPWTHFTVIGRKSFFVGKENGITEAWVPPFKILHDLQFQVIRKGRHYNLELKDLARYIWVRPEATTIRFVHSGFTIDATYFAPIESEGLVILFDFQSSEKLSLVVQFQTDLQPMWPGGLGGQFSYWDTNEKAFIISESRWKYAGLIGSPFGTEGTSTPAHAQPEAPVQFSIPVDPDSISNQFIPIVIAGSSVGIDSAKANYKNIIENIEPLYKQTFDHYKNIRENFLTAKLPDPKLSLALEWAKVSLDKGLIDNPQLGRGLVAGFGPSGKSARPGFAWYFGGDAAVNSWAINDYGGQETVKQSLQFFMKYQRDDGKIPHETAQSARMLPWFEEYPYPYYHAETTPFFLVAIDDYLRHFGDQNFVKENWDKIKKAYDYCLSADSNNDGLMDNIKAGLGAVELGDLRKRQTEVDIYLASIWTKAAEAMVRLAQAKGDKKFAQTYDKNFEKAKKTLNDKFWQNDKQNISFSLMTDKTKIDDQTTWQATPLCFDFFPPEKANAVMEKYDHPNMATDWGVHFLSKANPKYQYWGYNNGAVWPFTTTFVIWGGFRAGHIDFAKQQWENLAHLTFTQQLGAISELFSGDRFQPIEAAVPHQLFSTTPVIVGFTRGILGLKPDVPNNTLHFEPRWPRDWTNAEIKNIPFGQHKLNFSHSHDSNNINLKFQKNGEFPLKLVFSFVLLKGEKITKIEINQNSIPFLTKKLNDLKLIKTNVDLTELETIISLSGEFLVKELIKRQSLQIGETKRNSKRN